MLIWLHRKDPDGWVQGSHATVHLESGVGVWTANKAYGLHVEIGCDPDSAKRGHMSGTKVSKLKWWDKQCLKREFCTSSKGLVVREILKWSISKGFHK